MAGPPRKEATNQEKNETMFSPLISHQPRELSYHHSRKKCVQSTLHRALTTAGKGEKRSSLTDVMMDMCIGFMR